MFRGNIIVLTWGVARFVQDGCCNDLNWSFTWDGYLEKQVLVTFDFCTNYLTLPLDWERNQFNSTKAGITVARCSRPTCRSERWSTLYLLMLGREPYSCVHSFCLFRDCRYEAATPTSSAWWASHVLYWSPSFLLSQTIVEKSVTRNRSCFTFGFSWELKQWPPPLNEDSVLCHNHGIMAASAKGGKPKKSGIIKSLSCARYMERELWWA